MSTGKCLDVEGTPGGRGAAVVLNFCEDKSIDTPGLWVLSHSGILRNTGSDWIDQHGCISVLGNGAAKHAEGAKLHLDVCKMSTDQKWSMEHGKLRNTIGGMKCLDMQQTSSRLHNVLQLSNCIEATEAQWILTPDGNLSMRHKTRCIGISNLNAARGPALILQPCSTFAHGHYWKIDSVGTIKDLLSGLCLAFSNLDESQSKANVGLMDCFNANAAIRQRWDFSEDGFLQARGTHGCITRTVNGKGVTLQRCPHMTQRWEVTGSQHIWNKASNLCLDAIEQENVIACSFWSKLTGTCVDSPAPRGWKLVTSACNPQRAQQHWEVM